MTVTAPAPGLILPPGWTLMPVTDRNAQTATGALKHLLTGGPRDSIGPFVHELERSLTAALDDAAKAGAFAVAMPLGIPWEVPVSTSIALSLVRPGDRRAILPEAGELVETDAGPARRRIIDVHPDLEPDPAAGAGPGTDPERLALLRTIDYTWLHRDAYLLAFASISGLPVAEYAPVTEALTLLITTMLDTLIVADAKEDS